jgi:hypothetical protein
MRPRAMFGRPGRRFIPALATLVGLGLAGCAPAAPVAGGPTPATAAAGVDPRVGLRAGYLDAEAAAWNLELVAHRDRPAGFFNPQNPGDFGFANSDIAFRDNLAFVGSYYGFQIWDISNPRNPVVRNAVICPGGQGDVSVYGDLLFMSVEETRGRVDCGVRGVEAPASPERFRGVRIFDISNLDRPVQVAAVQTCRGSHTHTLVTDPNNANPGEVFIYVSGTSSSRPEPELAGCLAEAGLDDPNNPYFRIEVIQVPLATPQAARIVSMPRIFADPATGEIAGLWRGGEQGPGAQRTAQTNQCHDITVYPAIGLGAGACAGNGILLDIRNPVNPVRIDEVFDPNFAYWHSATFDNEGGSVIFTDEWGGGAAPRCRATDRREWGANAIFTLENRELSDEPVAYYKLPAVQTATENCVAHNGSLIPIPGRDVMVQAWYQGGISVFDFTDPDNPVEIAFFDRGPLSATEPILGGYWSAYWYNGHIYGSEITRGLDVFRLEPSEHLSANEIAAANLVRMERFNPQHQTPITWPAAFVVSRAYLDQLERNQGLPAARIAELREALDGAERLADAAQRKDALTRLATEIEAAAATARDRVRVRQLAASVRRLASA